MVEKGNSKFFFRTEKIETDGESFVDVPEDLKWAVTPGQTKPVNPSTGGSSGGSGGIEGVPGAEPDPNQGSQQEYKEYRPRVNPMETPVIVGIAKQEVSQDPEGKGTIDVTFMLAENGNQDVEWEIRLTR